MKTKTSVKIWCCLLSGAFLITCLAGGAGAENKTARIAYVEWSCATAASHVVKAVLEERMGYDCELTAMNAEAIWLSTASGDVDGFVCAWLPSLHRYFYGKVEYNVIDLGPNLKGTKVGLVVPDYVTIDSIDQLSARADKFDHRVTGIDPDAGIMRLTRKALKDYPIKDMELISGSGASMTETLAEKIKNREWVVVTGWTPHWKFARWDLKYLEDPENVYGGSESIHTMARKNLQEDKPDLFEFLDNFFWQTEDIHQVMEMIRKSGQPHESAVKWINQHPDKVDAWLK
ncbi:MAG: glycine betaine ABC transporter substrate-binding protein [Desulfosudaceae bacterium]